MLARSEDDSALVVPSPDHSEPDQVTPAQTDQHGAGVQSRVRSEQQIHLGSARHSRSDFLVHSQDFLKVGGHKHYLFDQDEFRDSNSDANFAMKSNCLLLVVCLALLAPGIYLAAASNF